MLSAEELSQYLRVCAHELTEELAPILAAPQEFQSQAIFDQIDAAQTRCLSQLASTGLWGKDNQLPSSEFWGIAGETIGRGPLQRHARSKPHGYAGDFEMLHRITNNLLGEGHLEREFDRFFQRQSAPRAVRSRTHIVADAIIEAVRNTREPVHVASVGAGPADDIRRALTQLNDAERSRLHLTLLDLDPHALDFAKSRLQNLIVHEDLVRCERVNLFRLPRNRDLVQSLAGVNLVVCTGLFDYLDDLDAAGMLQALENLVSRGGRLMVFNFELNNPSRAYMEWFGNWYLTYRTPQDLENLAAAAQLRAFDIRQDETGFDLYIDLHKS